MSVLDLARQELLRLKPYSSARMEAGQATVMLNSNESPFAPFTGAAEGLNRYPEPQPEEVLRALAFEYGTDRQQLLLGRGSDEAIDLLVRAFCQCGQDAILISPPTFGMYAVAAGVQGAAVVSVPLDAQRDFLMDFPAVLAAAENSAVKIVFVCSPNNPTGGLVPVEEVRRLARALSGRALVVVDEAYGEFAQADSLAADVAAIPNLAVLRTLSKAYGLAGARLGVLIAVPEIIGLLRRIMAPYPIPSPCAAAALAALDPLGVDVREKRLALILSERERVVTALAQHPRVRQVWPSSANFIAFRVDDARQLWCELAERGILIRDISHNLGLSDCLRVSIGTAEENDQFLRALR